MATQVASLFGLLTLDDSQFNKGLENARGGMGNLSKSMSQQISDMGKLLTGMTAPLAAAFGVATKSALDFDKSMTNVQAVLGKTDDQMKNISDQVLEMGSNSVFGAQAAAEAFYDVVGGVDDASSHMAILDAAIRTATAGSANLGSTTNALIGVMNSYSFGADKASYASDVMTQIVAAGVGTMDEFAASLPKVTGLSNSLGISFGDVGASIAWLTKSGKNPAVATTQLTSMMTQLLTPTKALKDLISQAGFQSGEAMIKNLGLVGSYQKLKELAGGSLTSVIANQEALLGSTDLLDAGFAEFSDNFKKNAEGATEAALLIQLGDPAAQVALLQSSIGGLSIEVGKALLPALVSTINTIKPVVKQIADWVKANPELVATIGKIVAVVATLGTGLMVLGGIFGAIGGAIGLLFSPIGLIIGAIAALAAAFAADFGGVRDALQPIIDNVIGGLQTLFGVLGRLGTIVDTQGIGTAIAAVINAFMQMLGLVGNDEMSQTAMDMGNGIVTAFQTVVGFIQNSVIPTLQSIYNWFVNDALPAVVAFVTGTVIPAVQKFFEFLGNAWAVVGPALEKLVNWFVQDALPRAVAFVRDTVIPGIQAFIDFLGQVWEQVRPALESLFNWFINEGLPAIVDFVTNVVLPGVEKFFNFLGQVWEQVRPALESLFNWFINEGLPQIQKFIDETVRPVVENFFNFISGVWDLVSAGLGSLKDWFLNSGLPGIQKIVEDVWHNVFEPFIKILQGIWTAVEPGFNAFKDGVTRILQPIIDLINQIKGALSDISNRSQGLTVAGNNAGELANRVSSGQNSAGDVFGRLIQSTISELSGGQVRAYAQGTDYVPQTGLALIHEGERIIPAEQNRDMFVPSPGPSTGGDMYIDSVTIIANDPASFEAQMRERRRMRG